MYISLQRRQNSYSNKASNQSTARNQLDTEDNDVNDHFMSFPSHSNETSRIEREVCKVPQTRAICTKYHTIKQRQAKVLESTMGLGISKTWNEIAAPLLTC